MVVKHQPNRGLSRIFAVDTEILVWTLPSMPKTSLQRLRDNIGSISLRTERKTYNDTTCEAKNDGNKSQMDNKGSHFRLPQVRRSTSYMPIEETYV